MSLLEVRGLSAGYGLLRVLRDLSFDVYENEAVVILGANGSGKTTTMRAISGLIGSTGSLSFDGTPFESLRADQRARLGIAHVPQGRGTFKELSVLENLRLGGHAADKRTRAANEVRVLDMFPRLRERRDQRAGNLSGGEQQMLAIGRALMSGPRLLLLDEPSLGLAPIITEQLFSALVEVRSSTTMLLVEQNAGLALELASRAYVLETGRIALSGTASEIAADDAVRAAYLGH